MEHIWKGGRHQVWGVKCVPVSMPHRSPLHYKLRVVSEGEAILELEVYGALKVTRIVWD